MVRWRRYPVTSSANAPQPSPGFKPSFPCYSSSALAYLQGLLKIVRLEEKCTHSDRVARSTVRAEGKHGGLEKICNMFNYFHRGVFRTVGVCRINGGNAANDLLGKTRISTLFANGNSEPGAQPKSMLGQHWSMVRTTPPHFSVH